jgi:Flp pilus assembly protein TadD
MEGNNLEIGLAFLDNRDYEKAVIFLSKFIDDNPNSSEAYENRAVAHFSLGDNEALMNDLNKAIELDATNENALFNRGLRFIETKEFDAAIADYQTIYALDSTNLGAIEQLAYLGMLKKEYDFADKYLIELLKLEPNNRWGLMNKAAIYLRANKFGEAMPLYYSLYKSKPDDAEVSNSLGYCFMKLGDLKQAQFYYKNAIYYASNWSYPIDNLGYIEYLRKNYDKAETLINQSIKLDPSNSYAYKNRALIHLTRGDNQLALNDLNHARLLGYTEDWGDEVEQLLNEHFS